MSEELNNGSVLQSEPSVSESVPAEIAPSGNFLDSLPEDLRSNASLSEIKDITTLAKNYINAQSMIGRSIRIPGEDAGAEALNEFYSKLEKVPGVARIPESEEGKEQLYRRLGALESADKYKEYIVSKFEGADPNVAAEFASVAKSLNLTSDQTKALVEYEAQRLNNINDVTAHNKEVAVNALRSNWGQEYDNRLAAANLAAKLYGEKYPEHIDDLLNGAAGSNPIVLAVLADLGKNLHEQGHVGMQSTNWGPTAEESLERISEIRSNNSHPFNDINHRDHKAAVENMEKLYRRAYPEN